MERPSSRGESAADMKGEENGRLLKMEPFDPTGDSSVKIDSTSLEMEKIQADYRSPGRTRKVPR